MRKLGRGEERERMNVSGRDEALLEERMSQRQKKRVKSVTCICKKCPA